MHMRHVSPRLIVSLCGLCLLILGLTTLPFLKFHTAASVHAASQPAKDTWPILPRPLNPNVSPPPYTTSLYETTTDSTTLYNQGCSAARGPAGLLVLDWGQPVYMGKGIYGTYDFGGHDDTDSSISHAVTNFVQGVWDCRTGSTNLAIGIGESNYYSGNAIPLTHGAWFADGQKWGKMVNKVHTFVTNKSYGSVVDVYGAGDLETEWETYMLTSSLVNGYNNTSSRVYFDFGDDTPGYWTNAQVWYVAYGATDNLPLPEIYYNADATSDWEPLDIWACSNEGGPIYFKGTMATTVGNSPDQAYTDMYNAEASNSCTSQDLGGLIFSTSITGLSSAHTHSVPVPGGSQGPTPSTATGILSLAAAGPVPMPARVLSPTNAARVVSNGTLISVYAGAMTQSPTTGAIVVLQQNLATGQETLQLYSTTHPVGALTLQALTGNIITLSATGAHGTFNLITNSLSI